MVDQAEVTRYGSDGTNSPSDSPGRAVKTNTREFLGDVMSLAELQTQLVMLELKQCVKQIVVPLAIIVLGAWVVLCGIALALGALALFIQEWTSLTLAQSALVTALGSAVLGTIVALGAMWYMKSGLTWFDQSIKEGKLNINWLKLVMRQGGKRFSK